MAQVMTTVCDDCGKPAVDTLSIKFRGQTNGNEKDVCDQHLLSIMNGARKATRGRPRKFSTA